MKWSQTGWTLKLETSVGSVYAKMPRGWRLDRVHPSALAVVEWILLHKILPAESPRLDEVLALAPRPRPGYVDLLAFSGGADSTAALRLSDARPVYLRRAYDHYVLRDNLIRLGSTRAVEQRVAEAGAIVVDNTFEQLGLMAGHRHGFHDGYGYAALIILLADHMKAGVLSFGSILDTIWMGHGDLRAAGSRYVEITKKPGGSWAMHRELFRVAGLEMSLPVGGCSETITVQLAPDAVSCPLPADDGTPCGQCFKCFRKEQLLGHRADPTRVRAKLTHRPLKMATSTIHGCHVVGYFPPELAEFADVRTDWTTRHYDRSLDVLCPQPIAAKARRRLSAYGIEAMTDDDVAAMKGFLRPTGG